MQVKVITPWKKCADIPIKVNNVGSKLSPQGMRPSKNATKYSEAWLLWLFFFKKNAPKTSFSSLAMHGYTTKPKMSFLMLKTFLDVTELNHYRLEKWGLIKTPGINKCSFWSPSGLMFCIYADFCQVVGGFVNEFKWLHSGVSYGRDCSLLRKQMKRWPLFSLRPVISRGLKVCYKHSCQLAIIKFKSWTCIFLVSKKRCESNSADFKTLGLFHHKVWYLFNPTIQGANLTWS